MVEESKDAIENPQKKKVKLDKEGEKKIKDNNEKNKNKLKEKKTKTVQKIKSKPSKTKFNKGKKNQERENLFNKELDEISKSSFARLAEPNKVDRDSHLRADKKPFLKKSE
ncbi:hypothetical protein DSAG12_00047 [Promethearchaeum syntrophicum]|uniref:Uncharacterized protein n=1 Tax=Promethearchaeum syntrophicum TaxID=2594042 RepID=A0A5B9D5H2_9ARCH|nr:hypothetical protein [Candidatus Prometheoarchaeum syntrophicum]QEE14236.1 hypothetical protein DSAG12_00047 [Candidatus Prometheoarchaeum syntrophicum]